MGRMIALETRYEVRTHVVSSTVAERLPAMCGSATLTTVVSSTSMNVPSMTATATIQGLITGGVLFDSAINSFYLVRAGSCSRRNRRFSLRHADKSSCLQNLQSLLLIGVDGWNHGHAGAKAMFRILTFIQNDLHRDPLHHFHVVAGRVIGGQQAEPTTCGAADGIDVTLQSMSVGIDVDILPAGRDACP